MTEVAHGSSMKEAIQRFSDHISTEDTRRFLLLIFVVFGLKVLVAWAVYGLATQGGKVFATFWMKEWGIQHNGGWPLLFHGWDSAWYIRIAKTGYSYPAYAFLPAYPFMIQIANLLIGEWLLSSFIVSFALGILAVPMFQLLAENYMNRDQAAVMTLLFSLFPPVFLFTSIAYTESLFTVAVLGAWLFCLRKRWLISTAFAVIASLTKLYGLLIALPLAMRLLRERRRKLAFLTLFIPSIIFTGWNYYLFELSGDWVAYWSSQNHWREGWPFGITSILRSVIELGWSMSESSFISLMGAVIIILWLIMIALIAIPIVGSIGTDRDFGLYGMLLFLFIVSFGSVWSFARFLPFILPAWLTVRTRNRFVITAVIVSFPVISLVLWYQFVVLGAWVG